MAEIFRCPSCSAPPEFEGKPMQKCRFCGSNVIVPSGIIQDSPAFGGADELFVASRSFVVKYKLNF